MFVTDVVNQRVFSTKMATVLAVMMLLVIGVMMLFVIYVESRLTLIMEVEVALCAPDVRNHRYCGQQPLRRTRMSEKCLLFGSAAGLSLGGLTISEEGGLEELVEFFSSSAIFSRAAFSNASSSATRFSSSAIRLSLASMCGILLFFAD